MEGMIQIGEGPDFIRERCELALERFASFDASESPLYGPYFAAVRDLALGREKVFPPMQERFGAEACGALMRLWAHEFSCIGEEPAGFTQERARLLETSLQLLGLFEAGDVSEQSLKDVIYDYLFDYAPDMIGAYLRGLLRPEEPRRLADGHLLRVLLPLPEGAGDEAAALLRREAGELLIFFGDRLKARILQAVQDGLEQLQGPKPVPERQDGKRIGNTAARTLVLPELRLQTEGPGKGRTRRIRLLETCRTDCAALLKAAYPALQLKTEEEKLA